MVIEFVEYMEAIAIGRDNKLVGLGESLASPFDKSIRNKDIESLRNSFECKPIKLVTINRQSRYVLNGECMLLLFHVAKKRRLTMEKKHTYYFYHFDEMIFR